MSNLASGYWQVEVEQQDRDKDGIHHPLWAVPVQNIPEKPDGLRLLGEWLVGTCWPVECPPECSRDMHMLWQQLRIWVDEDSLIWRHGRDLSAAKVSKQALVPGAL
ncbi:hypothetical protein T06_8576 [Trichinella sp. T6]|nr:hypothetical protein T06_8576 [Trichinella sp. T6]